MTIPFIAPSLNKSSFNCPHCMAFAKQSWGDLRANVAPGSLVERSKVAYCDHCHEYSIWQSGKMIYPDFSGIAPPNQDLNAEIQRDYKEAASITQKSPRGASALLRLCIQKLCKQLGQKGEDLNHNIGELVKKGLPPKIQKALDVVRVTGNEAVHPGELDLKDNQEIAQKLFQLVNFIAEKMISEPKEIDSLYDGLPKNKRDGIDQRDSASKSS